MTSITKQWQQINSTTPNLNENDPSDVKAIKAATEATGDYKLKTDPMYSPDIAEREGTSKKFLELLKTRRRLNDTQTNYNKRVIELKCKKHELVEFVQNQIELLKDIHKELKPDEIMSLENIPNVEIYQDQFENYCQPAVISSDSATSLDEFRYITKITHTTNRPVKYLLSKLIHTTPSEPTTISTCWSMEINQIRHIERLFQQQKIFQDIHERIDAFNGEIFELKNTTLTTEFECKYMDLYMLTLNQELWIIKDFEHLEEKLIEKIDKFVGEKNVVQTKLMETKSKIDSLRNDIDRCNEQEKAITLQFMSSCKGTKFFAYLKRIYQKKFKLPSDPNQDGEFSSIFLLYVCCVVNFY